MRTALLSLALLLPALPAAAQGGDWSIRPDGNGKPADVKVAPGGGATRITAGPASILWRAADRASGPFRLTATLRQLKAPGHPEGYGVFVAGTDLTGAGQSYVYFLVRGDGTFLVKRRDGAKTAELSKGWTAHAAVAKADAAGTATNTLEVDATRAGRVRFLVNGQEVFAMDGTAAGQAGLRVNHMLDVRLDAFTLGAS